MSDVVETLRSRIDRLLEGMGYPVAVDEDGDFLVTVNDLLVWVRPVEASDGTPVARLWSITNLDMRVDPDLTRFLALGSGRLPFAGLCLDERGPAVMAVYSIPAADLEDKELRLGLVVVAGAAFEVRPAVRERFGGELFEEE